jgi:shikimate kinase
MRGVGEATGAITVVNALPTGIGAAVGIGLRARAEVVVRSEATAGAVSSIEPDSARTPLVEATLSAALARFHPGVSVSARLSLTSEIPPAVGLKSSSAVQSAILVAVAGSAGATVSRAEVARAGARIARRTGSSATGAFDDALAGLVAGVVVTDNGRDALLRHDPVPSGLEVALWMPPGTHPPSPVARSRFEHVGPLADRCVELALGGDWAAAMDLNSEIVERAMGYPHGPLREEMRRRGALAAGTSGLGPAFAVVAPRERLSDLIPALPTGAGPVLRTRLPSGTTDPEGFR